MVRLLGYAVVFLCLVNAQENGRVGAADDPVRLKPDGKLSFEFPDLPQTLHAARTGEKVPPRLSAQLPENYSRAGRFPLAVYLQGGTGGNAANASSARGLAGPRDFIAVNLPLFKQPALAKTSISVAGLSFDVSQIITGDDGEMLGRCYHIMLQKLLDSVPNIERERSAIGGFSNGAHATAALLADRNPFIIEHFTSFYLIDGGLALIVSPATLKDPALKKSRFLVLRGDPIKNEPPARILAEPFFLAIERRGADLKLDFTSIIMRDYGHAEPPEYRKLVGNWVRGEPLPEIAKATVQSTECDGIELERRIPRPVTP